MVVGEKFGWIGFFVVWTVYSLACKVGGSVIWGVEVGNECLLEFMECC